MIQKAVAVHIFNILFFLKTYNDLKRFIWLTRFGTLKMLALGTSSLLSTQQRHLHHKNTYVYYYHFNAAYTYPPIYTANTYIRFGRWNAERSTEGGGPNLVARVDRPDRTPRDAGAEHRQLIVRSRRHHHRRRLRLTYQRHHRPDNRQRYHDLGHRNHHQRLRHRQYNIAEPDGRLSNRSQGETGQSARVSHFGCSDFGAEGGEYIILI